MGHSREFEGTVYCIYGQSNTTINGRIRMSVKRTFQLSRVTHTITFPKYR